MDETPVLLTDLVLMRDVLNTLYNAHSAQDLVDQYRKLDNRNRRSPLTNAIDGVLSKVEAYIKAATEEEEATPDAE